MLYHDYKITIPLVVIHAWLVSATQLDAGGPGHHSPDAGLSPHKERRNNVEIARTTAAGGMQTGTRAEAVGGKPQMLLARLSSALARTDVEAAMLCAADTWAGMRSSKLDYARL